MASKLDELMALVNKDCKAHGDWLLYKGGFPGEVALMEKRSEVHAALQDALKAVVEDAERYRWLRGRADACAAEIRFSVGDSNGGDWVHVEQDNDAGKTLDYMLDAAIDAARKP